MIVDLIKIRKSRNPKDQKVPVMSYYDPLWGFYTMTQSISYTYEDTGEKGFSVATVTINGIFTANAHDGKIKYYFSDSETEKKYSYNLLSKYKTLRDLFVLKSTKQPPKDLKDYGTSADQRCICLPSRLKDQDSDSVWMMPISIGLTAERSPVILNYTATLSEVKALPCKISIGSDSEILEGARITVAGMRPRINPLLYAFANGGEHVFSGYDNRKVTVTGSIHGNYVDSNGNGVILGSMKLDKISENGILKIKVTKPNNSRTDIFDIYIDNSSVSFNKDKGNTSVTFSGEYKWDDKDKR